MWDQANKRFSWFTKNVGTKRTGNIIKIQKSGLIPPKLVAENSVPKFYRELIVQCGAETLNKSPINDEVMLLMWRTGLPETVLQAIWESVSPSNSDQLSRQEFYSCLVLVALAQRNLTIADLSAMKTLPIPTISSVKPKNVKMNFKTNDSKTKPNAHLLKTVHPLFTEQKVVVDGDLIVFNKNSTEKTSDLELYPSVRPSMEEVSNFHESLVPYWERLLEAASNPFCLVKQTNSAAVEALKTEKGFNFLKALCEIQKIVRSVHKNASSLKTTNTELIANCEILFAVWTNLLSILEEENILLDLPDEFEKTGHMCNICGEWTSVNNTHFDKDTELSYHIPCVNLWLNLLDDKLPQF
ncbi:unnamed protein product [Bursaphelenchus okinawaensis]|uniref:EH domain-containing protein n=1 Tax=Bursaphelenchus okinawaensis TaxID=465554 RepID=A0A811KIR6_9BILA|nr:unnamed protein product [Bursaphelenchus okinawaensis]CAG9104024.1 unnamed protein product [Bursaphelenchus okinawaensis]